MKEMEKEKRDEKLNTALDSSNKGFAMLAKMGFKEGSGLGKHGQANDNIFCIAMQYIICLIFCLVGLFSHLFFQ